MALTDYSIDTSGTPQDVLRRQKLADLLMQQGGDTSPAAGGKNGGWLTALNRGLAGALGGYQAEQANSMAQAQRKQEADLLASYPGTNPVASMGTTPQALSKAAPAADTQEKIYEPGELNPMDEPRGADRTKMVATLLGEEKPGSPEGLGVANVIRNRAVDGGFGGDTPDAVVQAPSQFSPWNDAAGRSRMARALQNPADVAKANDAIDQAYGVGKYVASGPNDPTEGKTHFYDPGSMVPVNSVPRWAQGKQGQKIGSTLFFDNPDEGGIPQNAQAAQGALPTQTQVAQADPQAGQRQALAAWAQKAMLSSNAQVRQMALQTLEQMNKPDQWSSIGNGYVMNQRGDTKRAYEPEDKTPNSVAEYKFYKDNFKPAEGHPEPLDYAGFLSAKKAGIGTDSAYSPELLNSLADRLQAGDATWKTGMARIPGLIKAVEEEVAHRGTALRQSDPEAKPAETILQNRANQAGRVKEQSTLGGASATNTLYGNAAASTMQTAIEKSAAVPRGKFVPINRLMQMGETQISDPALAELRTATNTLVNDYAKAITPVGTPTDSAREHARELLDMATSHETYDRVVHLMHREIENTHRAIEFTKKQLRSGHGEGIPPLEPMGGGAATSPAAAGPQDGDVAHNPQTGETLIRKNGKWVPGT